MGMGSFSGKYGTGGCGIPISVAGSLLVKLTPQCHDPYGVALLASGADGLVVANTWLGMAIDINQCRPV